eukprot:CAMPEP_0181285438 /NCGR_PEP_ID=MMETSP1097-20121128/16000_1 /TAXON_ID=35684 /ORGANISM="Pseudopedinella elastica, Strain CCMP716" /LENGTH=32 /DNA_ID= /DNA_START= /DNA_END= /DNA_ORIENTATION=
MNVSKVSVSSVAGWPLNSVLHHSGSALMGDWT